MPDTVAPAAAIGLVEYMPDGVIDYGQHHTPPAALPYKRTVEAEIKSAGGIYLSWLGPYSPHSYLKELEQPENVGCRVRVTVELVRP